MPARILVIDDNQPNLDLMLYLLRAFGHDATGIDAPQMALTEAAKGGYDLIVTDIRMPGIDGFELRKRLRAIPALRNTPIVAVTALAMVGDHDRVLAAGFEGYFAKPIEPQTFVQQIDAFLPATLRSVPPKSPKRSTILIVDDDPANRMFVRTVLEHAGHSVIEAADATEGLKAARDLKPELVIVDLFMPDVSGAELIKIMRADAELKKITVVLCSASRLDAPMRSFMEAAGISHAIPKPSEPEELIRIVSEALGP